MTSDVEVKFGASTGDLDRGAAVARGIIDKTAHHAKEMGSQLKAFALGTIAILSIEGVKRWAEGVADAAERVDQLSQITGLSAREIAQWGAIAEVSGKSVESITGAVGKLDQAFVKAAAGGKAQSAAFKSLDIDIKSVTSANDALFKIADRFKTMDDGPKKVAAAMSLMGRSGKEMIPILNGGSEALREQMGAAYDLGAVWGDTTEAQEEFLNKGLQLDDSFDKLHLAMKGLSNMMVDTFAPIISRVVDGFTLFVSALVSSYREGGSVKATLDALAIVFKIVITVVAELGACFAQLWHLALAGAIYVVAAVDGIGKAIGALLRGDFEGAGAAWGNAMQKAGALAKDQLSDFRADSKGTKQFVTDLWSDKPLPSARKTKGGFDISGGDTSGKDGEAAKALAEARRLAEKKLRMELEEISASQDMDRDNYLWWLDLEYQKLDKIREFYGEDSQEYVRELRTKQRAGQANIQEEIRIAAEGIDSRERMEEDSNTTISSIQRGRLDQQRADLAQQESLGQITARQRIAAEAKLNQQLYQIDLAHEDMVFQAQMDALEEQLRAEGLRADDERRLNRQIEELRSDHLNRMRLLEAGNDAAVASNSRDAASAILGPWKQKTDQIAGGLTGVFTGWMTGMTTFQNAWNQFGQQLLGMVNDWVTKKVSAWLFGETAQTAATIAGATTRTTVEAAATTATVGISSTGALARIAHNAAVAASGVYASIASIPVIGPFLAPAMAVAALAAVLAIGKSIFSAEGGWGEVPHDGAQTTLHKKEMVLPAHIASPLRAAIADGSVGGGGSRARRGGGGDTYHVSAVDARSLKQMLERDPSILAGAMRKAAKGGHLEDR